MPSKRTKQSGEEADEKEGQRPHSNTLTESREKEEEQRRGERALVVVAAVVERRFFG